MSFGKSNKSTNTSNSQNQTATTTLDPATQAALNSNLGRAQTLANSSSYHPLSAGQIQGYENPYQSDVVNSTLAALQNQNDQQISQNGVGAAASGNYNSSRLGVQNALTNHLFNQTAAQTISQLQNQGFAQATQTAQNENQNANNFPLVLQQLLNSTLGLNVAGAGRTTTGSGTSTGSSSEKGFNGSIDFLKLAQAAATAGG